MEQMPCIVYVCLHFTLSTIQIMAGFEYIKDTIRIFRALIAATSICRSMQIIFVY